MKIFVPSGPPMRPSNPTARVRAIRGTVWLALLLAALPGCGRDVPPALVEGTLRLNGAPLDNCLITFLPEPGQGAGAGHSTALTDGNGAYRLRRQDQREGAAVGRHRVTVQDMSVSTGVRRRDNGAVDAGPDGGLPPPPVRASRVPERYMSPTQTPLRKEVKPGRQRIDLDIP